MTIENLFDVDMDNVHMVDVDSFEAAKPPSIKKVSTVTQPQLNFLKALFEKRKNNEEAMIIREHLLAEYNAGRLTVTMASQAIDDIKALPVDQQPITDRSVLASHGEVWVTTDYEFVRIKESNSTGNLYGLMWSGGEWSYELAKVNRVMMKLDHKITAEEAAAWGHEHQWCIFCSRPLSDPRSEFAGYGETCARKRNLPWGATEADLGHEAYDTSPEWDAEHQMEHAAPENNGLLSSEATEDVVTYPYGTGTCRMCNQPRPFVLNGFLRGCNC